MGTGGGFFEIQMRTSNSTT